MGSKNYFNYYSSLPPFQKKRRGNKFFCVLVLQSYAVNML